VDFIEKKTRSNIVVCVDVRSLERLSVGESFVISWLNGDETVKRLSSTDDVVRGWLL